MLSALPHLGSSATAYPDAVKVLRTALAASADGEVDVISIGYLNALPKLLDSPADTISSQTGAQLIAQKVRHTWVMGGACPGGAENNFNRSATAIAAAYNVVTNWAAPTGWSGSTKGPYITFLGYHVGQPVVSGGNLSKSGPTSDPVYKAFIDHGSANGRSSWDPMLALLAAIGDLTAAGYTSVRGNNVVNASGEQRADRERGRQAPIRGQSAD